MGRTMKIHNFVLFTIPQNYIVKKSDIPISY